MSWDPPHHIIQQKIFSVEECNKIINCNSTESFDASNPPMDMIDNIEENRWIRKRIEEVVLKINKRNYRFKDIELYNKIAIKTYHVGEGYSWHIDDIDLRRLSISIFLNNEYTGGDLRIFCGEEVVIKNRIGYLVAFPSWCFHQADKVLTGERKTLLSFMVGEKLGLFK